jgi:hypothetical protein
MSSSSISIPLGRPQSPVLGISEAAVPFLSILVLAAGVAAVAVVASRRGPAGTEVAGAEAEGSREAEGAAEGATPAPEGAESEEVRLAPVSAG